MKVEVEDFACAVVLCTFAVVRPLGEEEGVWVKGRQAEQRPRFLVRVGVSGSNVCNGHGPQASSGSQAPGSQQ